MPELAHKKDPREDFLGVFARDLSTKSSAELEREYTIDHPDAGKALEAIMPGALDKILPDHNPIYHLAKQVWFDNEDPADPMLSEDLHRDVFCREILAWYFADCQASDYQDLLLLAQRDSFKSTFFHGVLPMWLAMRAKYVDDKDVRILLLHHREHQASLNLQRLKSKCAHSKHLEKFWASSPAFSWSRDRGTKLAFDWPDKKEGIFSEPSVMAAGIGAGLTGLHFDFKLGDDLVTEEHVHSHTIRSDAIFRYGASRFMLDTKTGKEANSGTPYHLRDLWANLEKAKDDDNKPLYRSVVVSAGGKRAGKPLSYPSRHTEAILERKRAEIMSRDGTDIMWWLNYQCERRSPGSVVTNPKWIQYISTTELIKRFPGGVPSVILVDPAWKGTKNAGTGCDAALAVMGFERVNSILAFYLLDLVVSNEMTSLDGMESIFSLMNKWATYQVCVEEHQSHTFRTDLKHEADRRRKMINIIDPKTKWTGKNNRITAFLRPVQAGRFFIVDECPQKDVFLQQYEDFPQADPVDALDVVSYCLDPKVAELFAPIWDEDTRATP